MVPGVRAAGWLLLLATCLLPMTVSGVTLTCPDGWSQRYAKCYLVVHQISTNWDSALGTCRRHGGVLAEPSGYMLTKEAGALVRAADPALTKVWIGYNRRGLSTDATQGLWSDGRSATVAAGAWGHQEPDVSAGDCTYMQRGTDGLWYWYMANCDHDLPFVCQATPCPDTTFRCDNGRCVGLTNVCNKENNCADESDERNCPAQCSYYVKEPSGSLIYPTSGSLYLPTQTCQWVIHGALGTKLQLQFVSLNTEQNLDFVEVWVGGNTLSTSTLVQRISGKVSDFSSVGLTVSSNNMAVIRFLSDGNYQDSGFRLTWQSTFQCSVVTKAGYRVSTSDNAYSKQQTTLSACSQKCNSETQCVAYSYNAGLGECSHFNIMPVPVASTCCTLYVKTCPASSGFPNLASIPSQGGQLHATSNLQRFYSPLYPTYYLGDLSTKWVIHSPGRQIITLQVLDLDLAAGDMITVYDGSDTSATELATMSGSAVTAADVANVGEQTRILSTGSTIMIELKTRYPSNHRGFLFGYQAGCSFSIVANGGRVVSPGYKSGLYPNILNCQWIIEAEAGRSLTLIFDSTFGLENGKDYLQVTADGSSVHSGSGFTGSNPPPRVLAANGRIELVMQTGATGQATGFGATFNSGCTSISDLTLKTTYTANYGQSVVIECAADRIFASPYTGQNSVGLFCMENGQWSHSSLPTCTRVFCGPPVDISNGYLVSVTGVNSGDTATYRCEDGFQLSSNVPSIVCRSNGRWDNTPFCFSARSCPAVNAMIFGRTNITSGSGFSHGSVVNFNCTNPLYELNGSPNLLCKNGSWSGGFPSCERIPCPVPYIVNGSVNPSSNLYDGQPLTVICNRGFQLTGAAIFNCRDSPPSCINVNECQSGSGCSQNCTDTVGSYYCSCRSGYLLQPDGRTCLDVDECSVNNGNCDGICINSVGSYRCDCIGNTGLYTFDGEYGLFIPKPYENGLEPWNLYHLNHTCVQTSTLRCPTPPQIINNGHLLGETGAFTVGDTVTYLCDMGYHTNGTTTLRCSGSGVWDAAYPVCYVATCPVPAVATGTIFPQTPIRYLEYYNVTCDLFGVNRQTLTARCVYDENFQSYRVDVNQLHCNTTGVDCGVPTRLPGSLPYNVLSTGYGAQFTFQCRTPVFTLVGQSSINKNAVVVCGADGVWDFGDLRCEGPTCPDPGTKAGTAQVATTYEEFSLVAYQCTRAGFSVTYPWPLYCQYNASTNSLMWNGTAPTCADTDPPKFPSCPTQVHQVSYLASALFTEPVGTDNVMVKELSISPANFRTTSVIKNTMQVSYVAKDLMGNIGTCNVTIQVRDDSPPVINCQDSIELQLNSESQRAVYDPLTFVDSQANNSSIVNLDFTINPLITDYFSTGNNYTIVINRKNIGDTYTVKIVGKKPSGNLDSCLVQIRVTAPKCVPYGVQVENSATTCSQQPNGGYRCDIKCSSGYKFYENPDTDTISMTCNPGADWNRNEPVCTRWYYTNYRLEYQMDYRIRSEPTLACQSAYLQQLSNKMSSLTTALTSLCSTINPPVTVTAAANINSMAVAAYTEGLYATFRIDLDANPNNEIPIIQCANTITSAFTSVSSSLQSIRSLSQQGNCAASETAAYRQTVKNTINCPVNQESRVEPATSRFQCVVCPLGYTSAAGFKCSACSVGSYYDSGTTSCQFCPPGTNSQTTGARFLDDCYLQCPYGYVSSTGLAPCSPCPQNTYSLNRTYCEPCPSGLATRGDAQGYPQNCLSPCQPGNYSFDGYSPCLPCPRGYFQDKARATTCTECSSDTTTRTMSSTSASSCVPAVPIVCNPNPCVNGNCTATDHDYLCLCQPGYTGRNCETAIQPCDSNPCYNNAICTNNGLDYQCVCTRGLTTGKNCETDITDNCNTLPCSNFGACQDLVEKHICLCPSFSRYTYLGLLGSDCTTLRNPCAEKPCVNSATCVNLNNIRHKCVCPDGYTGDSCQNDINYCGTSTSPCQNGASCRDGPGSQVTCTCAPGYTGQRCEVRLALCDATVCGPSSTCVDNYLTDQVRCYCIQGYKNVSGVCTAVVINPCDASPCQNGATCYLSQGSVAGYGCICSIGYEGQNCQHDIDDCLSKPCLNGGLCTDMLNGYRCACPPNTRAPVCQDAVDQCSGGMNPCSPRGTLGCVDYFNGYTCNCLNGYYGVNCTEGRTNCASFPCRHGATCTDVGFSYQCRCPDGYEDSNCESMRNYCNSNPCFNGGLCVNTDTGTVCNCPPGYRGDRCETVYDLCTVANPCTVAGSVCKTDSLNRPTCTCPSGYNGSYCEVNAASCTSITCQNGGTCHDVSGQPPCICLTGYTGSRCETNIDECSSSPCSAGKVCVDEINSYTCECADNRIGDSCKELSVNFDLVLQPHSNFKTSERLTFSLGPSALTVATWVRFTERTSPGTLLSLYSFSSQSRATSQQLLRMDKDQAVLNFAGARTLPFTSSIDDGYWHHVVFTWDGLTGQARLFVDNVVTGSATNYGQGSRLPSYGWLILGGVYNSSTGMADRSSGMAGRLSRLHVSTQALPASDVSNLYSDFSLVPSGAQQALTKSLLVGTYSTVDYNSQLTLGYCRTQSGCRSIDQVAAQPSVISCPDDQMVQTDRKALPTWTSASFQSSDTVITNYLSGSTELDWGDYGVYYTQSDDDGDSAVCTFTLHNRRSTCVTPVPPHFGSQSCVATANGQRCEPQCSGTYTMSEASPRYYICGQYNMFDLSDRVLQFTFPSCTTCKTPLHNLVMSLNFSVNTSPPCATGQSQLPSSIRGTLNDINSKWQQGLCGTSCSGVRVDVTCPADASQGIATNVYLNSIQGVLRNFDGSVLRSASEILSIEMADNNAFAYPYASTILSSLVIDETKTCSSGNVLLGDCCIECGLGHYLDTNTGACTACPLGTYLDQLGQTGSSTSSPCKTCPSGTITPEEGAQAETDCKTNCLFGRYYDYTTGQCELCPIGYYAENPGAFYCDPCPVAETTLREGSTARASCSVNPITTTVAPVTTTAISGGGNVGASTTGQELAWPEIILVVLAIILLIVLVLIILFCCFRDHLVKACPCLISKVKPKAITGWHYVDRFGETKMKFASYRLADVRARKSDQDLLNNSVEEGSVHTNISLQVPVFEEKLNGQVTKKSVHMSDHTSTGEKKAKRKKKRRVHNMADLSSEAAPPTPLRLTPSNAAPAATELPADGLVRRPLSAFNKPRPTLDDLPYENFVSPKHYNALEDGASTSSGLPPRSLSSTHHSSRIMIDSD